MNNDKAFIKHEILNLITVINFEIADSKLDENKKKDLLDRLKMVSLLTSLGHVFLGKKKRIKNLKINLDETLDIVHILVEKKMKQKKVKMSIKPTKYIGRMDRNVLEEGLQQILFQLMSITDNIHIRMVRPPILEIHYDGSEKLEIIEMSLLKCLKAGLSHEEIFFRTALHLMKLDGIEIAFQKNLIELKLP